MRPKARISEIVALLLLPAMAVAQDSPQDLPAARAADTYAVYSAALGDRQVTYSIADRTAIDLVVLKEVLNGHANRCATPPEGESREFREALDDLREQSHVAYRLEDRFRFHKAKVRMVGADEKQRDRLYPYRLSSVGFSKDRSLALVIVDNVHPMAGSERLSIFKRTAGRWEEQTWKNDCWIVAELAGPIAVERT